MTVSATRQQPGDIVGRRHLRVVHFGTMHTTGDEPLHTCLDSFAEAMRADNAANRTISARIGHLQNLYRATGIDPRDLTGLDVTRWLGRPHLSRNSRHTYYGHIAAFTRWLISTRRNDADPLAGMRRPRPDKLTPRPVPQVVVDRLLRTTTGTTHSYVVLEAFAGLRAHEVAKIRGQDVTEYEITVRGKGGRVDTIPTHPLVWDEACKYPPKGWWFPTDSTYGHVLGVSVSRAMSRAFDRIGLDGHGHQLRAHYATTLLQNGVDIQTVRTLMRHSSLATTQLYLEVSDDRRRAGILSLGGLRGVA